MDPQLAGFIAFATVLTVTPGSDMALIARNTITYGRRAGLITSTGVTSGLLVHACASAVGLSAVLRTSATAYGVVKLAGAGYLIFLGLTSLLGRGRPSTQRPVRVRRAFAHGFLNNILNPKVALFYLAVLPQFVRPGDDVLVRSLVLATLHIAITVVWLGVYTLAMDRLRVIFSREAVRRAFERVSGAALVALGLRVATS